MTEGEDTTYILASDGYVIDRWKPIHGFLDTSDIKHLTAYTTPQTVNTPTQQSWRVYSQPIRHNEQNLGVVTVGVYLPTGTPSGDTDKRLIQAADTLASKIAIKDNTLNASRVDIRDISFDISFEIVDRFNKIVAKSNNANSIDRLPNYIDLSYIGDLLNSPSIQQVQDSQTHEPYLFHTTPVIHDNTVLGVLVVGRSIAAFSGLVWKFILFEVVAGIFITALGTFAAWKIIRPAIIEEQEEPIHEVEHITFSKKDSTLLFDNQEVAIPYATNQYYLCEVLFSNPKKRWETDELLERFGEQEFGNSRKVYDAMIIVNKKAAPLLGTRLILAREKTYQINPSLLPKVLVNH
jgi:hypothetical protein